MKNKKRKEKSKNSLFLISIFSLIIVIILCFNIYGYSKMTVTAYIYDNRIYLNKEIIEQTNNIKMIVIDKKMYNIKDLNNNDELLSIELYEQIDYENEIKLDILYDNSRLIDKIINLIK